MNNAFCSLEGRVAVVTGAARGIGQSIAELLARQGATVILADRDHARAKIAASLIETSFSGRTLALPVDVSDALSAKTLIDQAIAAYGRLDILVNNAGITRDTLIMRMEEVDWDIVINVNLKGAFNCSKAAIRQMMKQRYGRIINISSVSGQAGQVGQTNYSASKAGLIGFTKALAREVASRQITVNAVAPGFVPTALTNDLTQELKETILKMTPLGRMGKPEEIASAVVFLASDEAAFITGQVLAVDGGMVMM
jgi:3-oxoacyl-[acyl-carrier protein] reductase